MINSILPRHVAIGHWMQVSHAEHIDFYCWLNFFPCIQKTTESEETPDDSPLGFRFRGFSLSLYAEVESLRHQIPISNSQLRRLFPFFNTKKKKKGINRSLQFWNFISGNPILEMGTPEFPDLGKHCTVDDCKQIDFLPFTCDRCHQVLFFLLYIFQFFSFSIFEFLSLIDLFGC